MQLFGSRHGSKNFKIQITTSHRNEYVMKLDLYSQYVSLHNAQSIRHATFSSTLLDRQISSENRLFKTTGIQLLRQ